MTHTTPPNDVARCPGRYENLHGEFGSVAHPQCIGCKRRIAGYPPGNWYLPKVPVFHDLCPKRIGSQE